MKALGGISICFYELEFCW